jgi:hypothetical protein
VSRSEPGPERPSTFQGWQRGACIILVLLLAVATVLLLTLMALGALGIH